MYDKTGPADHLAAAMTRDRGPQDGVPSTGAVVVELRGPDGTLKSRSVTHNIITERGDQYYGERAAGISSPPGQVTGMKLGTGSVSGGNVPAKTGSGAALTTYLSDSHIAINGSYPQSSLSSGKRRITWQAVWGAGKATSASPITEVVLVIDTLADATSNATNTIARAVVADVAAKTAQDSLTITWTHDLGTV
jgi:hypothetical protein